MVWPLKREFSKDYVLDTSSYIQRQSVAESATSWLEHNAQLQINSEPDLLRHTAIWVSLGEATFSTEIIYQMICEGANILRLSYSIKSPAQLHEIIKNIREAIHRYCCDVGRYVPIAISSDGFGAAIQIGFLKLGQVFLPRGHQLKLTPDSAYFYAGTKNVLYMSDENLSKKVRIGTKIIVDFGECVFLVTGLSGLNIICKVVVEGKISSRVKIYVPGLRLDIPNLTEKDIESIHFCIRENIDIYCPDRVESAENIKEIRNWFTKANRKILIVCKIATLAGIQNLEEIIKETDGIFIGRGYVSDDIGISKLHIAQKSVVGICNLYNKPCTILGQLLTSVLKYPVPRKSDTIDIANVAVDGGSSVMSHNETTHGQHPVVTIRTFHQNLRLGETALWHNRKFNDMVKSVKTPTYLTDAVAIATVKASLVCHAAAIIVLTTSGTTATLLSKYFPQCPIIAVTKNEFTAKKLCLYRSVVPLYYKKPLMDDWQSDVEARIQFAIKFGKETGLLRTGELIIIQHSAQQASVYTDTMRFMYLPHAVENILIGDGDY